MNKLSKRELFHSIMSDPQRKSISQMLREVVRLTLIHKELPRHYFTSYLFKKDVTEFKNYLPANKGSRIAPGFNDQRLKEVLDNKLYFSMFYGQYGLPLPRILMFNHGVTFSRQSEIFVVKEKSGFISCLKELFRQNSTLEALFIKKIYASARGADIYKITLKEIETDSGEIEKLYYKIISSEYLFQEAIVQHNHINNLNPASVNTLRIDTFLDQNENINILSGYLRMSLGDSHVDNISSGGCKVGVDMGTGVLKRVGYPDFKTHGATLLTHHPVTGTEFAGFRLPFLGEIKDMVVKAASLMPGMRIIGWDVAISETGPVLIEGNSDYVIRGNDVTYGGYLAHPVLGKEIAEI